METLIFSLAFAACGLVAGLLAKAFDKRILVTGVLLFAIYLALDDFVTGLPHLVPALRFLPGEWNWSGKLLSLAFSALVTRLPDGAQRPSSARYWMLRARSTQCMPSEHCR